MRKPGRQWRRRRDFQAGSDDATVWLGACLLVLLPAAPFLLRASYGPSSASDTQPRRWKVENNELRLLSAEGRLLWKRSFDFPLTESLYRDFVATGRDPVVIDDLDGDGNNEVLFLSEPVSESPTKGLYCFNADGSLRFRHQPNRTVHFGDLDMAGPWRAGLVVVTHHQDEPAAIWFASFHRTFFPTVLEKLTPAGAVVGEYWSNGQVSAVQVASLRGRRVVLVGGTNNETKGASLAVLDESRPTGAAPAERTDYICRGCPPGGPLGFLVFPRLDVAEVLGAYAYLALIRFDDQGQLSLGVRQLAPGWVAEPNLRAYSYYVIGSDLHLVHAELGWDPKIAHQRLEQSGRLTHSFGAGDQAQLFPVLRWNGSAFDRIDRPER